jgi:hypothetical protein
MLGKHRHNHLTTNFNATMMSEHLVNKPTMESMKTTSGNKPKIYEHNSNRPLWKREQDE